MTANVFYFYSFANAPGWRALYIIITSLLGLATQPIALMDYFQQKRYHSLRASLFIGFGVWCIVPTLHTLSIPQTDPALFTKAFWLYIASNISFGLGALLYAIRIPECWAPGRFDLLFHSHNLLHISCITGTLFTIFAPFPFGNDKRVIILLRSFSVF